MSANPFKYFADLGYSVVSISPPGCELDETSSIADAARGKAPAERQPNGKWKGRKAWQTYQATAADIEKWHSDKANVGIRMDGLLRAIDIDASVLETADAVEKLCIEMLGPSPLRVGRWPRRALLYRLTEDTLCQTISFDGPPDKDGKPTREKIEIAVAGKQIVAYGRHPSGVEYSWPRRPVAFADIAQVTPEQFNAWRDAVRSLLPKPQDSSDSTASDRAKVNQAALVGDVEAIRKIVRAIPNNRNIYPDREHYINMGIALRAALPHDLHEAYEIWIEWAAKDNGGEPAFWEKDWERICRLQAPFALGLPWLKHQAKTFGHYDQVAEEWHEAVPAADTSIFPEEAPSSPPIDPNRFSFLPFHVAADMAMGEKTSPLIKGLLDQGAMSVMYGDSNTGKTFVAMDMGFHIGAGLPYAGMKVSQEVVIYIAAEGGRGAKKRLMALREKFGDKAKDVRFYLLATSVNLRDPAADLKPLIESIGLLCEQIGAKVGFLVVDTMSRALAGGDENSSVDVGLLVKNFDALRAATGAHLMVVHHSGKDRARGARGWSGLRAATDTELEVADGVVAVGKQRDLDKSWSSGFELEVRTLGLDSDGDPITSCTVRLVDAAVVRVGVATATEQDVLDAMDLIARTDAAAARGVSAKLLERYFADNKSPMTAENLRYYVRQLETKCLIEKVERGRWVRSADHPPLSSKDKLSERHFEEVEESGGNSEAGVFD